MKILANCRHCGASFETTKNRLEAGRGRFCSKGCTHASMAVSIESKLWSKVDKRGEDECWLWLGAKRQSFGYGAIHYEGKMQSAHRVAYLLSKGPIPDGLVIMHTCDNAKCCNPNHLKAGTQSENIRDMYDRGRMQLDEKHPMGKLSAEQKRDVKRIYQAGGVTLKQVGAMFGITATHAHRLVHAD